MRRWGVSAVGLVLLGTLPPGVHAESPTSVVVTKIVLMAVLGPLTFAASLLPWAVSYGFRKHLSLFLSLGSAFTAGIILGGGCSHLLPDAVAAWNAYFAIMAPTSKLATYPFAELLGVGLLFVLVAVDKLVVDAAVEADAHILHHSQHSFHGQHHGCGSEAEEDAHPEDPFLPEVVLEDAETMGVVVDDHAHHANHMVESLEQFADGKEHKASLRRIGTAYLFLAALSVHGLFDGLGLGAEENSQDFFGLCVAVVGHKMLDGFALGIPMFHAQFSKMQTAFSLLFAAMMTPLGIGLAWWATSAFSSTTDLLMRGIMLSLSFGSFLYISLIELLPAGLSSNAKMGWKLFVAVAGWAVMALLALWV